MRDVAETLGFALPEVQSPYAARPSEGVYKVADRLKQQAAAGEAQRQDYMQRIAAERLREQQMRAQEQQAGGAIGGTLGSTAGGIAGAAIGSAVPVIGTAVGGMAGSALGGLLGNLTGRNIA